MDIRDRRGIKAAATASLQEALPDYRKLVLLHMAISLGASLVLALLNGLLEHGIGSTGGLSGLGLRSILVAIQSFLSLAVTLAMPLWETGVLWTAIRTARRQKSTFATLAQGFRRFGPVLRLLLLRIGMYFLVGMICTNIGSMVVTLLPVSQELTEMILSMQDLILEDPMAAVEQIPMELLMEMMLPALIVTMVLSMGAIIHLQYRFCLADYLVVDEIKVGAMQAMRLSNYITKGSKWALFRLHLSLWWYYALQVVLTTICFGDQFLPGGDVTYWVCYGVYVVGTLALTWFAAPYIHTVHATAYDLLRGKILPPDAQQ